MSRVNALMTHGIKQLEELFFTSAADPEVLNQLEDELRYRQAPDALKLLIQVQDVLNGSKVSRAAAPDTVPEVGGGDVLPMGYLARRRRAPLAASNQDLASASVAKMRAG